VRVSPKRLFALLAWITSGVSIGVAAGLVRWSFWWPHSDIRQNYATFGILILSLVGVVALGYGVSLTSSRHRLILAGVTVVLAAVLSVVVYDQLIDATAASR
jgi:hypothetical protein